MTKVRQAVVMVGGQGTRLRPLTNNRPKAILPILDKPCLRYLLESMVSSGVEEIILACGYRSSQLEDAIGHGSDLGIMIKYSYEDEPLGTGGAMKKLESSLDDVFIAANGDVLADIFLKEQIDKHISSNAEVTISLTTVDNPCEFGIARLDGEDRITEFKEKPKPDEVFSNLVNAGVYVVNKTALSHIPENTFFDFSKDLLPILMREQKRIQGFPISGTWRDVGRPMDLLGANLSMASKLHDQISWGGSRVESSTIRKPFYLGNGASINGSDVSAAVVMENTVVTESKLTNTMIMRNCKVSSARIENSIIGENCTVCPGAEIISSVIGDGLTIDAGRKIDNELVG